MGKMSPEYKDIYYFFVSREVGTVQQRVSQSFVNALKIEVKASSMIGKAILNIIVMIMMAPITLYQSAVNPSYCPANIKFMSPEFMEEVLKLRLSNVMITPIFKINRKALLNV